VIRSTIGCAMGILLAASAAGAAGEGAIDWPAYGRDIEGTRYLPASEITPGNVQRLEAAWTYRTGETQSRYKTRKATAFETTPLVVDGVMYLSTPLGRVIALDPATGHERWVFDPGIRRDIQYGDFASRGVATWLDEDAPPNVACRRTIYAANAQSQLIALDAANGHRCRKFGRGVWILPSS